MFVDAPTASAAASAWCASAQYCDWQAGTLLHDVPPALFLKVSG
jgi:hypothetical protein